MSHTYSNKNASVTGFTLALKLFFNGIKFRIRKSVGRPGKIQALSIEITHNCIAKCIMCNIWKIPKDVPDLSNGDWLNLLSSDFFQDLRELDITGGEPFSRKDFQDLFSGICDLKQSNLKNLKSIAITTNGFLTEQVLETIEDILPVLGRNNIDLIIVCAMDAIGSIHNMIRNFKDGWEKVDRTIKGLKRLREKHNNLIIGIKTTILPVNVKELDNLARYAYSNGLFTIISPRIITEGRYLNDDLENEFEFSRADIKRIIGFFEGQKHNWSFHSKSLIHYFKTGRMIKPCSCGFNYMFIRSSGDVHPCPLINKNSGNIKNSPIKAIFNSKISNRIRRRINKFPECEKCTEPGLERYALPCEGFTYLSGLLKIGPKEFNRLHRETGLDKYLVSSQ